MGIWGGDWSAAGLGDRPVRGRPGAKLTLWAPVRSPGMCLSMRSKRRRRGTCTLGSTPYGHSGPWIAIISRLQLRRSTSLNPAHI